MTPDPHVPGWNCRGDDITQLMHRAIRGHLFCPNPDAVLNIETHLFNVTLYADSCDYELDLGKDLWLNGTRWSRLIKEYVSKHDWERFLWQTQEVLTGSARMGATVNMMFREPERTKRKHRWGGCLMSATFRGDGDKAGKPTITFFSRTTYMGYMGLLDAGIAHVMANEIALRAMDAAGKKSKVTKPDQIAFRWHIASQQLHCFKTLPYVYSQPDLMARLLKTNRNPRLLERPWKTSRIPPTLFHMGKWYNKVTSKYDKACAEAKALEEEHDYPFDPCERMLAAEKYGPFRRIQRRWLEAQGHLNKHVPPSLSISALDLSKAV